MYEQRDASVVPRKHQADYSARGNWGTTKTRNIHRVVHILNHSKDGPPPWPCFNQWSLDTREDRVCQGLLWECDECRIMVAFPRRPTTMPDQWAVHQVENRCSTQSHIALSWWWHNFRALLELWNAARMIVGHRWLASITHWDVATTASCTVPSWNRPSWQTIPPNVAKQVVLGQT